MTNSKKDHFISGLRPPSIRQKSDLRRGRTILQPMQHQIAENTNKQFGTIIILCGILAVQTIVGLMMHYGLYQSVIKGNDEYTTAFGSFIIAIQSPAAIFLFAKTKRRYSIPLTFVLLSAWIILVADIKDSSPCGACKQPKYAFWLEAYTCP